MLDQIDKLEKQIKEMESQLVRSDFGADSSGKEGVVKAIDLLKAKLHQQKLCGRAKCRLRRQELEAALDPADLGPPPADMDVVQAPQAAAAQHSTRKSY